MGFHCISICAETPEQLCGIKNVTRASVDYKMQEISIPIDSYPFKQCCVSYTKKSYLHRIFCIGWLTAIFQKSVVVKHLNITAWEKYEEQVLSFAFMLVITVIITNEVLY